MSRTTPNQANIAHKSPYHTPKLKKFGSVSELTLTSPFSGFPAIPDGGGFSLYIAAGS